MPVVDASFLVATWETTERAHDDAHKRLAKLDGAPLRINAGALLEASRIIRRAANDAGHDGARVSREFLAAFMALPGATIAVERVDEAWRAHTANPGLSFADAWVIVQARAAQEEAWSYDKGLLAALRKNP